MRLATPRGALIGARQQGIDQTANRTQCAFNSAAKHLAANHDGTPSNSGMAAMRLTH
jgi:hypothetical protein